MGILGLENLCELYYMPACKHSFFFLRGEGMAANSISQDMAPYPTDRGAADCLGKSVPKSGEVGYAGREQEAISHG